MASEDYEAWFERTFKEREDALIEIFGQSHPPGAPEGHVLSIHVCGSGDHEVLIPGACVTVCPPAPPRKDWAYVTVGLSQPGAPEDRPWEGDRGNGLSGHGAEFGMMFPEATSWAGLLLAELMGYSSKASSLYEGHRVPFGVYRLGDGAASWFIGMPDELDVKPLGDLRALLFWPYLGGPRWFTTGTGNFELLLATGITDDEWRYAKETSSPHLQLLLFEAGIGQCTRIDRASVFTIPDYRRRADELRAIDRERIEELLRVDRDSRWPFADPRNVAVFTTRQILSREQPILHVSHDEEDGAWQFHDGQVVETTDAKTVSLECITRLDESVMELADLPLGWIATRTDPKKPWRRRER